MDTNNATNTAAPVINYGLPTTININGKDKSYDIDALCAHYEKTNRLPAGVTHIYCTKSLRLITCFGGNLLGKVAKHGGIKELLTTFVCKDAGGVIMRVKSGVQSVDVAAMQKELDELKALVAAKNGTPTPTLMPVIDVEPVDASTLQLEDGTNGALQLTPGAEGALTLDEEKELAEMMANEKE